MGIFNFLKGKSSENLQSKSKTADLWYLDNEGGAHQLLTLASFEITDSESHDKYGWPNAKVLRNVLLENYFENAAGKAQGSYQKFGYATTKGKLLPNQEEVFKLSDGQTVFRFVRRRGSYENGKLDGLQTIFDEKGKVEDYVRYKKGKCIAGNYEIRKEWAEKVESLKFEKQADKKARSDALKKVLEAGTREGKKEALKEFHKQKSPVGVKRRTALKFDR